MVITEGIEKMTSLGLGGVVPVRRCEAAGERRGRKVTFAYLEKELDSKGEMKWD